MLTVETPTDNLSELTTKLEALSKSHELLINVQCEKAKALLCKALRLDLGSFMGYEAIDQAIAEGLDEVKAKLILNVTSRVLHREGLCCLVSDDAKAAECFLMAAKQGYAPAQFSLALLYESGQVCFHDHDDATASMKAFEWYRQAAKQGYGGAQEKCNEMVNTGQICVIEGIKG